MSDDFSNEPMSLGEYKAERDQDGSNATVRDLLVATLRRIDRGEMTARAMFLVVLEEDENAPPIVSMGGATKNNTYYELMGAVSAAQNWCYPKGDNR